MLCFACVTQQWQVYILNAVPGQLQPSWRCEHGAKLFLASAFSSQVAQTNCSKIWWGEKEPQRNQTQQISSYCPIRERRTASALTQSLSDRGKAHDQQHPRNNVVWTIRAEVLLGPQALAFPAISAIKSRLVAEHEQLGWFCLFLPFHFYIMETWKLAFCLTIQRGLHSSAAASAIEIVSDHCHKLEPQLRGLLRLSCFNMAWSRFPPPINVCIIYIWHGPLSKSTGFPRAQPTAFVATKPRQGLLQGTLRTSCHALGILRNEIQVANALPGMRHNIFTVFTFFFFFFLFFLVDLPGF